MGCLFLYFKNILKILSFFFILNKIIFMFLYRFDVLILKIIF
jgi:hypothetical protein